MDALLWLSAGAAAQSSAESIIWRPPEEAAAHGRERLKDIFWLHAPKTGSSFTLTLSIYECGIDRVLLLLGHHCVAHFTYLGDRSQGGPYALSPPHPGYDASKYARWPNATGCSPCMGSEPSRYQSNRFPLVGFGVTGSGFHSPLPQRAHPTASLTKDIGSVVAFFRPSLVLLSSAYAFVRSVGHGVPDWGIDSRRWHALFNGTREAYFHAPGVGGCQAKMLLGHACFADVALDGEELQHAVSIVDQLAFVGLTDDWDRSLCLWHAKFGSALHSIERLNTRPTGRSAASFDGRPADGYKVPSRSVPLDVADNAVYARAAARFVSDVRLHGQAVHECLGSLRAQPPLPT